MANQDKTPTKSTSKLYNFPTKQPNKRPATDQQTAHHNYLVNACNNEFLVYHIFIHTYITFLAKYLAEGGQN